MKAVLLHFHRFFVDPLSVKELSGISRRWQMYVGRCIYLLLVAFILWLFWSNLTRTSNWMSPSVWAELGRNLFYAFFALQLASVTLSGVSAGSDMITRELRGGTLGLLALTPLTPWRIVAGLSYNAPRGNWGGQLIATYSSKKSERDTRSDENGTFIPDAFAILDATAYWNLTGSATLRVGVFNITDEKYWWWNDVRGVATAVDAYTQPGTNVSASIAYRF